MSDKVKWAGSGTGCASRSAPVAEQYVPAKVYVNGSTHLGQIIEGVCFAMCNNAHNPILLPVADSKVECEECLRIMKRNHISVNMTVQCAIMP